MSGSVTSPPSVLLQAAAAPAAIPATVIWSYAGGALVLAVWLAAALRRRSGVTAGGGDAEIAGHESTRLDRLTLFGSLFYAAPVAAFGIEHFTTTKVIASIVPSWIPWHYFWAYFVGACFIGGALSVAAGVQARLSASLLSLTFFLFVVLMDAPGWARHPDNRFALALMLRELSFSGGALALAATLTKPRSARASKVMATVARYFLAVAVVFYAVEQFLHADHVAGIPLRRLTPDWIFGHALWTYLAAGVYAATGTLLLLGRKTRAAATWLGMTVLFVELVVYVPIGIVDRASLNNGLNYVMDTLMFAGAVLLLAGAMPREADAQIPVVPNPTASLLTDG